jgi:hypothetical protein
MIILSNYINLIGIGSFLLGFGGFYDSSFPLKEDLPLFFNILELPSPKNVQLKFIRLAGFGLMFNVFLLFCYHLLLQKGFSFNLNKLEFPLPIF